MRNQRYTFELVPIEGSLLAVDLIEVAQDRVGGLERKATLAQVASFVSTQIGGDAAAAGAAALAAQAAAETAQDSADAAAAAAVALTDTIENPTTRASPDTLTDGAGGALEVISDDGFSLYAAGYAIVGTTTTSSLQTRDGAISVTLDDAQGVNIGGGYQQTMALAGEAGSDGVGGAAYHLAPGEAAFAGLTIEQDASGNVAVRNLDGKPVLSVSASQGWWTPAELEDLALQARVASLEARDGLDLSRQPLDADINVILVYGQSNAWGSQSHPQLTLTGVDGVLMLGNSERPDSATSTTWTPAGSAAFNDFVSTAVDSAATTTMLSQAAAAALSPTANAWGETVAGTAVNYMQQVRLDGGQSASARRVLVLNCAVPGAEIAQLTRGASPDYFLRTVNALTAAKAVADAASLSIRLAAVIWAQGEADFATTSIATYKTALGGLMDDLFTYGASAVLGQTRPFGVFIAQTASGGVIGNDTVTICQAQREIAAERQWAIARRVGTSKGLHHCPNGARWTGMHLGFALRDELVYRRRFVPVQPIDDLCGARGNEVLLTFQAPAALAVADYWSLYALTSNTHRGLSIADDDGALTITAVEVVNGYLVRVTVDRPMTGTVTVACGYRNVSFGDNGIFSMVNEWVPYNYEFITGMDAAADLAALVDLPYPAKIPSLLFSLDLTVEAV